jgi:hypothetical protein
MNENIIVTITTMPSRFEKFKNIFFPNIVELSLNFSKICITVDDNVTNEIVGMYQSFIDEYNRKLGKIYSIFPNIELVLNDYRFGVVNKLAGPVKKYGTSNVFISLDDDIFYKKIYIDDLLKYHKLYPNDVICMESNPTTIINEKINVECKVNVPTKFKTMEGCWKFLTNCALYPNDAFKNTRLLDINWIQKNNFNKNDEIFFWAELLSKGIKTISTSTTWSIGSDDSNNITNDDSLTYYDLNNWNKYNLIITENYPQLINIIKNSKSESVEQITNSWKGVLGI